MIGDDPRELGPASPPYFCEQSPKVFMEENDHYSIHTLAHDSGSKGHELLLTILRAVAWADAARAAAREDETLEWTGWDEIAHRASDLEFHAFWLIVDLIGGRCLEWGVSMRTGWLTDDGWRALWAHEIALELELQAEREAEGREEKARVRREKWALRGLNPLPPSKL